MAFHKVDKSEWWGGVVWNVARESIQWYSWVHTVMTVEEMWTLCHVGPPLWSVVRVSRFDSQRYQIFWEVVGLERGLLSLVSTTEELLGRKCSGPGLENRDYGCRDPPRWPRNTLYPQKLILTLPTSRGCMVGIVHSLTKARELLLFCHVANIMSAMMKKKMPVTTVACNMTYGQIQVLSSHIFHLLASLTYICWFTRF
jgi:hypothetical protein